MIWGGEFGRTPMGEVREKGKIGRNHHIDAFTLFMAGGGIKAGQSSAEPTSSASHRLTTKIEVSRYAGDHPAPARPRPHEADLSFPGTRFPADGCGRPGAAAVVAKLIGSRK